MCWSAAWVPEVVLVSEVGREVLVPLKAQCSREATVVVGDAVESVLLVI